jgi:hypothetical protein
MRKLLKVILCLKGTRCFNDLRFYLKSKEARLVMPLACSYGATRIPIMIRARLKPGYLLAHYNFSTTRVVKFRSLILDIIIW